MKPIRQLSVFLLLAGFAVLLGARLYYWQVLRHDSLSVMARAEHYRDELIPARRGSIYDASGNVLATNEAVNSVYAARKQIDHPHRVANILSPLLGLPAASIYQSITNPHLRFIRLKPWVSAAVAKELKAAKLGGIFLEPTTRRIYSQGSLAAQILGFVNQDGKGQYGLEEAYNSVLAGQPGHLKAEVDTAGRPISFTTPRDSAAARNGADLITSVDSTLQYVAERELAKAVKQHGATGGSIVIMDPRTGDLLADANLPSFDPNTYATSPEAAFANPSISQIYEPGSTFKIVTMSIGLAEHAVAPTTTIHDSGALTLGGIHITNWNGKGHSPENMIQVLEYSSNVGAATVGWRVGASHFYRHIKDFGFDQKTGIDMAGEVRGDGLFPGQSGWTPANLVTNSFGQGLALTPLQLVTAVSAVANGGLLMKPRVVTAVRDANGVHPIPPTVVRRVLDPTVARTLTDMLVQSAVGEAQLARVPGFEVAAKTGTAQIASPKGGYLRGKFIASLMGFAPANNPRFVMLVKIDEPSDVPWGSEVAAPVWRKIAKQIFVHFKIQPTDPAALARSTPEPTPVTAS
ncbi:MAG: peptidoglycan D,D-transpeptidase FtsI family protein, partial [Chloroflexota bacterium]